MIGAGKLTKQGLARSPQSASLNGAAEISTTYSKFGTHSLFLPASSVINYLTVRRSAPNFFNGNGTAEFWFLNLGTYISSNNAIYDQQEVSTENVIFITNTNRVWARTRFGATTISTSTYALNSVGTWNHIAITLDDNVYLTLWANGQRLQTIGNGTDTLVTSGGTWNRLGSVTPNSYYNEYRLSTIARYDRTQSTYTVPTEPFVNDQYTYWLFHFDEKDDTTSYPVVVDGDVTISSEQSKFGSTSFKFADGTADYLLCKNFDGAFNHGTGDFTIEMFFYTSNPSASLYLYDARAPGSQLGPTLYFSSNILYYYANGANRISGGSLLANTWYHVAVSRSGTSTRMFLDGVQIGSTYSDSNNYTGLNNTIFVGSSSGFSTQSIQGYIDEIRVSNTARYTSNFTPTTTEFTSDANTIVLLHGETSEIGITKSLQCFDDARFNIREPKVITAIENTQISTAQSKFGGASALFDGNLSYLRVENSNDFNIGGSNWTMEGWCRFDVTTGDRGLFGHYQDLGSGDVRGINIRYTTNVSPSGLRIVVRNGASTAVLQAAWTPSTNTWYHVAIVRNGTTMTAYVDGTSIGSTTLNFDVGFPTTAPFVVGQSQTVSASFFDGYIDEVRYSNTARYTANFTPSTTAFTNDANTLLLLHMDGDNASTIFSDDNR